MGHEEPMGTVHQSLVHVALHQADCPQALNQSAVLNNIENPYFYLSKLQKITLDIKADIQYPNDLRPKENHGYNTEYKG